MESMLDIAPDVAAALAADRPVVALESTIIAHGMRYPRNVETAIAVEDAVRAEGAVPATIAILDGRLKVGLERAQIERLGNEGRQVAKVSRRDIPFIVAAGGTGATTVAATMILAAMAGVRIFATGGIGGVHRGAAHSFDISADLQELAQTNVAVVCAGAKSILDLGLTLEYLETRGVPVVGYRTDRLPAFYTRESGFGVDYRLDSPEQIAAALRFKWALDLEGGVVIANPIPESHAMPTAVIDAAIEHALQEADEQGIHGKATTPFLLARVAELTGGDSLEANIRLVLNNARLAAQIAVAYGSVE
ncbi:pseudouridine-5'-phosphate glycosidase [Marinobacterium nitratireducens]|uniref:Pseudouridine-5'-phosphate glycosidase n=1 Tax=Marinobacterium nitratireducens TaxID=518897 RepID=A0A917ZM64_9GAMM|nr:pseudouridine-5'-phosphate glycosidase [Marinobacterium nitratireducens]GGO85711.1 pseudouridine-5'-phosphate glycosidase [Marinobacterium nitratireducens]